MKQMSKEELIEYFIGLLGDNRVLKKYISIDEMREKLNSLIKNVTYKSLEGNVGGYFCYETGEIALDFVEDDRVNNFYIVHELLHVLSSSVVLEDGKKTEKSGLQIKNDTMMKGISLNEGITNLITEEILGISLTGSYALEKDFSRVMLAIFGKENVLDYYFSDLSKVMSEEHEWDDMYSISLLGVRKNEGIKNFVAANNAIERITTINYNTKGILNRDQERAIKDCKIKFHDCLDKWVSEELKKSDSLIKASVKSELDLYSALVQYEDAFKLGTQYRKIC